jgi:hypothetical protein
VPLTNACSHGITPSTMPRHGFVITQVMEAARQRYAADERVQLDTLADHFVSVFRDAELPFNKLLAEQPLPKVHLVLPGS